jgi:hypothetical protein
MKHLFVPYELALLAKEKGFPQNVGSGLAAYDKTQDGTVWLHTGGAYPVGLLVAPLYQQLVDWFESKKILINVERNPYGKWTGVIVNDFDKKHIAYLWNKNIG